MNSKKWLKIFAILSFLFIGFIGLFNYLVDPLWLFNHSYKFNNMQKGFEEKKSKTFYLLNNKNTFDSLLLGSSRSTYYNQLEFKNMNVFNYSFSAAKPYEYIEFIDLFKKEQKLENLIIGMDFFTCLLGENENPKNEIDYNKRLINDIKTSSTIKYFLKNYLTYDMVQFSFENLNRFYLDKTFHRSYTRNNIVKVDKVESSEVEKIVEKRVKKYYKNIDKYDPHLVDTFNKIISSNKNVRMFIYTTPLSKPFLDEIFANPMLKDFYFKWLRQLVNTFENVYFTTYYNELSYRFSEFSKDGDHYYPYIGKEITQYISKGKTSNKNINISKSILIINKQNLNSTIHYINSLYKKENIN